MLLFEMICGYMCFQQTTRANGIARSIEQNTTLCCDHKVYGPKELPLNIEFGP